MLLRMGEFFSTILSLFLKNLVALHWNNLLWTLLVVNKEKMWTTTLALASITGPSVEYVPPWNQTMAAMLIAIVPVLLLYIFFQKYFVQSVAMSGIK